MSIFTLKNSQNYIYAGIFRKYSSSYDTNNNDYNSNNANNYLILYKMVLTSKDQINDYNLNSMSTSTSIVKNILKKLKHMEI